MNPFNYKASRALSLFNSKQRFVINYVWDIPVRKYNGFAGKVLDDWQLSGIIQFQSGFPIRLQTQDDTELISSLFFLGAGCPAIERTTADRNPKTVQTFNTYNYGDVTGHYYLNADQTKFTDPTLGTFATTPRSVCCGPGENQWDITICEADCAVGVEILPVPRRHFQLVQQNGVRQPGRQLLRTRRSARCCRRAIRAWCSLR